MFFATIYWLVWKVLIEPIQKKRRDEYWQLYGHINDLLSASTHSVKDIENIRQALCLLENLKYKNKEMTEVLTVQWLKLKYGMTRQEMADTIAKS